MLRTFEIDVEKCDQCGGRPQLRALVIAAASIERVRNSIARRES